MKMRCYRRLPNISYTEPVTHEEVRNRSKHAIGPYEDLLTTVKIRRVEWYDHVSRFSGLSKTILQGTVNVGRRRGVQKKAGMSISESLRASKDRQEWREMIRRSVMARPRLPEVMR